MIFVYVPHDSLNTAKYAQDLEMAGFDAAFWLTLQTLISSAVLGLLLLGTIVEFFIRKKDGTEFSLLKKIPSNLCILYSAAFWAGLIFAAVPTIFLLFI